MSKFISNYLVRFGTIGITLLSPLYALAQSVPPSQPPTTVTSLGGILGILCNLLGWAFIFFLVLAVLFIILAAFKYLTARGDETKVKSANQSLIYAVVAIVVAVLARGLPVIIGNVLGANDFLEACRNF